MNEQVFLGGAPVVGFGETTPCYTTGNAKPIIGLVVGGALGAFIGNKIGKGHPIVGAVAGGAFGVSAGALWAISTEDMFCNLRIF